MMGSDYPFDMGASDPVAMVGEAGLDAPTRLAVEGANAVRFLKGAMR
jgi:aminocarboxymuconate-semialdehyde decarboxylase